jgi:hypothetical protein
MNKKTAAAVVVGLACFLSPPVFAQKPTSKLDLVTADWSVKSAHNLASNPPPTDRVQAFVNRAFGTDLAHICAFRFADLRHCGNLSLVVDIDAGGKGGCNDTHIFDKTPSGFEEYSTMGILDENLRNSVSDINHDGNLELVIYPIPFYGPPTSSPSRLFGCDNMWPMIFAWTGSGYTDVSSRYRGYYARYLKSLKKRIAANSAAPSKHWRPTKVQPSSPTARDSKVVSSYGVFSTGPEVEGREFASVPEEVPPPATAPPSGPDPDYDCLRIEAAKAEAFLGIHSDATMSDAIKASESNDPDERAVAAAVLSYIGTPEAKADLKVLAADSDPAVAKYATERLSYRQDPAGYAVTREPVDFSPAPNNH